MSARPWSRRDFLTNTTTVGGALIVALSLPAGVPTHATGRIGAGKTAAGGQVNAWLRIAGDNTITMLVDRSEMGQGVYTALPMLLAEELHVALAAIRIEAAPVGEDYVNQGNGGQVTGTSNSVSDAWDKLRLAGAGARMRLIAAAATAWRIDPSECRADTGHVLNTRGQSFTYGELAAAAAKLPTPKDVKLKSAAEFTLIGRNVPRLDTRAKCDGSAQFSIDVKLPRMLHAALALPPVLGTEVAGVDAAAARQLPGVRAVLQTPQGVIVVAEHFWQALRARESLAITWTTGTNATPDNASMRALLHQTLAHAPGQPARVAGDVARALHAAHSQHTARYDLPLLAHATMEPQNCTADVTAQGCDLYVGTQVQQLAQAAAAQAAGIPVERVRVHTTLLGGGFGRRLDVDFIPAAVIASKALGVPVKLIWTREDDMTHDYYRPPAAIRMDGGLDATGALVAWGFHSVSPSITARFSPGTTDPFDSVVEGALNLPYEVPNITVNYTRQEVGIDVGYMRSVSHAINCFAIESFMDELAAAAGRNPLEFRAGLLAGKPRHLHVLREAARLAGYGSPPKGRFQGLALMEGYNTHIAQVAEISIAAGALEIHKITCVVDCGQMVNPAIVQSQIEGGIVFGLSAALWGDVTLKRGQVQETNFNDYRLVRHDEMPQIHITLVTSDAPPGGVGEPSVALVAPAIGNAVFAATGRRIRALPLSAAALGKQV